MQSRQINNLLIVCFFKGKKEKRRGILDVENYVMSICQDNIASQKTNDKEGDSDRISNYDNVAMEPLLCQNPDVQKHRESNRKLLLDWN